MCTLDRVGLSHPLTGSSSTGERVWSALGDTRLGQRTAGADETLDPGQSAPPRPYPSIIAKAGGCSNAKWVVFRYIVCGSGCPFVGCES